LRYIRDEMLSEIIKKRIEDKFGRPIRYSKDCEILAAIITEETKRSISGSTLKRVFGLVEGTKEPRLYTLDVLAMFLGHQTWEALINDFNSDQYSGFDIIQEINASELTEGEKLKIRYAPERELVLECLAPSKFRIKQSQNSKLQENDIVYLKSITRSYPLFFSDVLRKDISHGPYVAGKLSGITHIEKL
jgi:hypothetical protein